MIATSTDIILEGKKIKVRESHKITLMIILCYLRDVILIDIMYRSLQQNASENEIV